MAQGEPPTFLTREANMRKSNKKDGPMKQAALSVMGCGRRYWRFSFFTR